MSLKYEPASVTTTRECSRIKRQSHIHPHELPRKTLRRYLLADGLASEAGAGARVLEGQAAEPAFAHLAAQQSVHGRVIRCHVQTYRSRNLLHKCSKLLRENYCTNSSGRDLCVAIFVARFDFRCQSPSPRQTESVDGNSAILKLTGPSLYLSFVASRSMRLSLYFLLSQSLAASMDGNSAILKLSGPSLYLSFFASFSLCVSISLFLAFSISRYHGRERYNLQTR